MTNIVSIVEGEGEVAALPVLLRRLVQFLSPEEAPSILPPIRVKRDRFIGQDNEFSRMLLLAAAKSGEGGWILILLDADDDCPSELAASITRRANQVIGHRRVSVVLANREYEAWFLAASYSLHGKRGFSVEIEDSQIAPECIRGAKEWMARRMLSGKYRETTDQPAFSALLDLAMARKTSRSFRKLCSEWLRNVPVSRD